MLNDAHLDQDILVIALEQRGETYRVLRRLDDALADLNSVIDADPGRPVAIGSRGETYRFMGRYDEALADFNRATELDPGLDPTMTVQDHIRDTTSSLKTLDDDLRQR